jgi:hypothetical protein
MQNFGKIKTVFNNLLIEGIVKKDDASKKLFKKYLKTIKESEILKTQFLIYNNIENKIEADSFSANLFVSENIKLLEKYNTSDILKENKKLLSLIKESKEIDGDEKIEKLHESLSNLIFTKRTPQNIEKITEELKNVSNYIVTNKPKEVNESVDLPVSILRNLMVDKYNEKYSTLDESDKEVLKVLIESNFQNKKRFYKKTISECVQLVDSLIKESDEETKEKLVKVKSKLLEDREELNENDFLSKISKLIELKNNLKSN